MIGHIDPFWDILEFKKLNYKLDVFKDPSLIDQMAAAGHLREQMTMYNYFEPNPMPTPVYDYIVPKFDFLENINVAVNLFKPTQYIPVHVDLFGKYKELHNIADESKIRRIILMLEDSVDGQISVVNNTAFSRWSAGNWFGWEAPDPHAFYNFSVKDRYALQITGTIKS